MAAAAVSNTSVGRSPSVPSPVPMLIPITITCSATVYATATGGLPFDLYAFLAANGPFWANSSVNAYKDILGLIGFSLTGHMVNTFAVGTVTSTTVPCTAKVWNGTTELADGATSITIVGFLIVARSGAN